MVPCLSSVLPGPLGASADPAPCVATPGQARHGVSATGNNTQPAPRICVSGKDAVILQVCRGVAQSGSVLAWGARGRVFESLRPDQNSLKAGCSQEQPAFFMASPPSSFDFFFAFDLTALGPPLVFVIQ